MTDIPGNVNRNKTTFTACRQYTGESVLTFDDPADREQEKREEPRLIYLPAGLILDLSLDTPIRWGESAVGDPVTFRVRNRARRKGFEWVPKQAIAHGRIMLLREQNTPQRPGYAIGIRIEEIVWPGTRARTDGVIENMEQRVSASSRYGALQRPEFKSDVAAAGSVFFVKGSYLKLERGFGLTWHTRPVHPEEEK